MDKIDIHAIEIIAFTYLATLIGLLAIVRMSLIELFEMAQTMLNYILEFHHHVKRFRARLRSKHDV